jgi:hypothetical protein
MLSWRTRRRGGFESIAAEAEALVSDFGEAAAHALDCFFSTTKAAKSLGDRMSIACRATDGVHSPPRARQRPSHPPRACRSHASCCRTCGSRRSDRSPIWCSPRRRCLKGSRYSGVKNNLGVQTISQEPTKRCFVEVRPLFRVRAPQFAMSVQN